MASIIRRPHKRHYPRQSFALDLAAQTEWAWQVKDTVFMSGSLQITNANASMAKLFSC